LSSARLLWVGSARTLSVSAPRRLDRSRSGCSRQDAGRTQYTASRAMAQSSRDLSANRCCRPKGALPAEDSMATADFMAAAVVMRSSAARTGISAACLLQVIRNLANTRIGTDFVLLTAGRTGDADCADCYIADLDRNTTANGNHVGDLAQVCVGRVIG
jgi:hypothetical protein